MLLRIVASLAASPRSNIRVAVRLRLCAGMRDRAEVRRTDQLRVFPDCAGIVVGLSRLPGGTACGQLGVRQLDVDRALLGVDHDGIAILQQRDRSTDRSLWSDVADAE